MSDELKLLDCPFCGCGPDFLLDEDKCPYVTCHSCDFKMPAYRPGFEHMAIAAWNRRATPSPSTAPIAEDERAASAILKSIIEDGYLSETNVARYHALASKPAAREAARQSIDTGEFRELLNEYWRRTRSGSANKVTAKIIAHIDTWGGIAPAK